MIEGGTTGQPKRGGPGKHTNRKRNKRNDLPTDMRKAFQTFFIKAGLAGRLPAVVVGGSRGEARQKFASRLKQGEDVLLLVDSEGPVDARHEQGDPKDWLPWEHLKKRDDWQKPKNAKNLHCHLMVESMENWFLADQEAVERYFGKGYKPEKLPSVEKNLEKQDRHSVNNCLKYASNETVKGEYDKGRHSFEILAGIDPNQVIARSQWAARFIRHLKPHQETAA